MSEIVLRKVALMDATGHFDGPMDIHVADGVVRAVGTDLSTPGADEHDASGLFLMPGVFDCHAHLGLTTLDTLTLLDQPVTRWALEAAENARLTLEGGVTFVRDPGGIDAGIRDAIGDGLIRGPTTQVSVTFISQTGGHVDGFLRGAGLEITSEYLLPDYPGRPPYRADGVDQMRSAVRETLRAGADWIKLCTTGGVLSLGDRPEYPELTLEEIETAVFEASRRDKPVIAHANGGEGLVNAVRAGVRSIEHATFLTEEEAQLMASAGCWMVPTLAVMHDVIELARSGQLPPEIAEKALGLEAHVGQALGVARDAGISIAVGTDAFRRVDHGRNLRELALMAETGMPSHDVLVAATAGGATLCGVDDRYGRLEPGYVFDAILLDDDPSDCSAFAKPGAVTGVYQGGAAIVTHPRFGGV